MKKFIILLLFFILFSCASKKQQSSDIICPKVLYSKQDRVYITTEESEINLNNISYKAKINNHNINSCYFSNDSLVFDLSILFVVEPHNATKKSIELPFYIALINNEEIINDIQFYIHNDELKKDTNDSFLQTDSLINNTFIIRLDAVKEFSNNK